MIHCHLTYCNILWGCAATATLHKLMILQNRAVRLITRSPFRSSASPIFAKLQLLKIADINKFQTAQFMYNIKHHHLPNSCMRYTMVTDPVRIHNTRNFPYFSYPRFHSIIRENCISVRGPRLWNTLSVEIQSALSIASLKRLLIKHYCDSYRSLLFLPLEDI